MDENIDNIFNLNSKCSIHLNQVFTNSTGNEKKKVARKRWAILAKALKSPTGSEPSSPTDEISLRRISSFMLLNTQQLSSVPISKTKTADARLIDQTKKRTWYKYSLNIDQIEYFVNVGHRNRTFSAEDLMGFNNTGNVCIWPSEETLTYYICSNLVKFNSRRVLELGGGMSCLAGLFVAKYGLPSHVTVTDGNKLSVENVLVTLQCNEFTCPIECKLLKWGITPIDCQYDLVLCADCLFFDDARTDLIDCLWNCLSKDGIALIMAPERGCTLDNFIKQSKSKGFVCVKIPNYNEIVWQKRLTLLENCDYEDNIHYPILIQVTKI